MRERAVDLAIATTLACLPLLPAGPTWFGLQWPWALEAAFLVFAVFASLVIVSTPLPERGSLPGARRLTRLVGLGYLIWLIPVVGATIVGLLERTPFDPALMRVAADGMPGRLAMPMNQAADALYPLRVGLTAVEGGLMFFLVAALLARSSSPGHRARVAIAGCLTGLTIVSIVAVLQYVTRANLHEYWVRFNPDLTRSHATLDDPNALASFLVLGIGLAVGVALSADRGRRRNAAALAAVLACAALVTTVSRAGLVALGLALVIVAAVLPDAAIATSTYGRRVRRAARTIALAGACAVIVWVVAFVALPKRTISSQPDTPLKALLQTVDPREPAATILKRRHIIWGAGVQLFAMHWAAGAGMGQFPWYLATYPGSDGAENAHNYFLQVLAEGGAVGFLALIALLGAIAMAMRRGARSDASATRRLALGLSGGILAFMLTWLTGHPLLTLSNQLWFAAVLAAGVTAIERGEVHDVSPHRGRAWVAAFLLVSLAVTVPRAIAAGTIDAGASHAAGVYAWEPAPPSDAWPTGTTFRWTRGRAAIREPVAGAVLVLPIFMTRPDIAAQPIVVDVKVQGAAVPPLTFTTNGWHVQSYDLVALLGEARWRSLAAVRVEFVVRPPVVPARIGPSLDERELGIGLGVVSWRSHAQTAAK